MKELIRKRINDILYRYSNVEDIDEMNNIISDITSTLRLIREHMEYYEDKPVRQIVNIRKYLQVRRNKLARKRRIA
jgi:hypothetical protein